MRGLPSTCAKCGVKGTKRGSPSWGDVCIDENACRERMEQVAVDDPPEDAMAKEEGEQ